MPRKVVLLNYQVCDPESCPDGVCSAAQACCRQVLKQPAPHQLPELQPGMCLGCADCLPLCSRKALVLT